MELKERKFLLAVRDAPYCVNTTCEHFNFIDKRFAVQQHNNSLFSLYL
jgi:hypothetical protein